MGQEDYHPWGVAESKLIPEMMLAMQQMLAMIRELQS